MVFSIAERINLSLEKNIIDNNNNESEKDQKIMKYHSTMRGILIIYAIVMAVLPGFLSERVFAMEGYRVSVTQEVVEIPSGGEGIVAIKIDIPAGYHIYSNPVGPGTGKPTEVRAKDVPKGLRIGAGRYPEAKKHFEPGDRGYVRIYDNTVYVFLPVRAEENARVGTSSLEVEVEALVCGEGTCVPMSNTVRQAIVIVPPGGKSFSLPQNLLEIYSTAREPGSAEQAGIAREQSHEGTNIPYNFEPQYVDSASVSGFLQAVLFGLLAGFILNFMPCVLPVVSLKVMSFVSIGGDDRRKTFLSGAFFSLGIIVVFLVLASLAAFLGYGWGELFKRKEFLIAMTALVFALALSMFDVFTITLSFSGTSFSGKPKNIYLDSFGKGVIATFLATPCSGPFLGGTLAWTMMQPPTVIFTIFVFVGIGMALPYIFLAAWPSLLKIIPKPGEWTIVFERIMGFLLLATVVYLLGIIERNDVVPMLWMLLFVLAAFWQYGKYGSPLNAKITRYVSMALLIVLLLGGYWLAFQVQWGESIENREAASRPFTLNRIIQNSETGKVSLVQFTADWCPNCKVVERTSLYTEKVMQTLRENDAELLVADITRGNSEAEALMKKLGSRSIPFLAVFPPGEHFTRPFCLRDLYTEGSVIFAVKEAGKAGLNVKIENNGLYRK